MQNLKPNQMLDCWCKQIPQPGMEYLGSYRIIIFPSELIFSCPDRSPQIKFHGWINQPIRACFTWSDNQNGWLFQFFNFFDYFSTTNHDLNQWDLVLWVSRLIYEYFMEYIYKNVILNEKVHEKGGVTINVCQTNHESTG